ncbi:hypothetical protein PG994_004330 [Apiospora phragmitis]|uniref:Ankyrin n=1 Tax=Apiospora phragmitis TaxID=2905665 RepID=A0ABR1VSZ4_9PEZI
MEILKFPAELVHEVLFRAALCRDSNHSVKRALRLRLVCKAFAEAVYPALFRSHRLDDAMFNRCFHDAKFIHYGASRHGALGLWHRYLVYRVTGEKDPSVGRFVETRELAQILCEQDASQEQHEVVQTLCWLALDNITRGPYLFRDWGATTYRKYRPNNTNILRRLQKEVAPDHRLNLLAAAVRLNKPSLVRQLLADGHDPTKPNYLFPPAMQVAAECGNESILRLLLDGTSRPQLEPYSIFGAAVGGDLEIMRLVFPAPLPGGPPPTADGSYGRITNHHSFESYLLVYALCATESPLVYEYLTQAWAADARLHSPRYEHLTSHAARGNLAMVRHLLDQGVVAPQRGADDGSSSPGLPLRQACRHGHGAIVDLLLARGADPNHPEDLLARGVRVCGPHKGYEKPLMRAFKAEHTELARLLVAWGAPLQAAAPKLFAYMAEAGYESMLDILRGYGLEPDPGAKYDGGRHYSSTCKTCTTKVVGRACITRGGDPTLAEGYDALSDGNACQEDTIKYTAKTAKGINDSGQTGYCTITMKTDQGCCVNGKCSAQEIALDRQVVKTTDAYSEETIGDVHFSTACPKGTYIQGEMRLT